MRKLKGLIVSSIAAITLLITSSNTGNAHADSIKFYSPDHPGQSTITISTNNTGDNQVAASGALKSFLKGGYVSGADQFYVTGVHEGTVSNGQKLEVFVPTGIEQGTFIVSVKTVYAKSTSTPKAPTPKKPAPKKPAPKKPVPKKPTKKK